MKNDVRQGSMFVCENGVFKVQCPLKHTSVKAKITGFLAEVEVEQEFSNPSKSKIEAVYTFPLSANAAVFEMVMKIGKRVIFSEIKRKEDARKLYEQARAKGQVASLLEQQRPNLFTQSVANILPNETIHVTLRYFEVLAYENKLYNFVFPMVSTPRYIPGNQTGHSGTGWANDTDRVPDASKVTPLVVPPEFRAGHDISLDVELDAGFNANTVKSKLHEVEVKKSKEKVLVNLKNRKTIPNRDFILQFSTLEKEISSTVLTSFDGKEGNFLMILQPPKKTDASKILPKEMIFVIDDSGSMNGWPIEKAKETMKHCVMGMHKDDTFQMYSFASGLISLFDTPKPNNESNVNDALRFLAARAGNGGTEMLSAVNAALAPPHDPARLRTVCFMSDCAVGNEFEILDAVNRNADKARFFVFGVGHASNRYLVDTMAEAGRGEALYVTTEDNCKNAAKKFHELIANPLLTDIAIEFKGVKVEEVYPERIKDLHSSKPVVICGKFKPGKGAVILTGNQKGKKFREEFAVDFTKKQNNDAISKLWARKKIDNLMAQNYIAHQNNLSDATVEEITKTALKHHLMSQYTSLVAIEKKLVRKGKLETVAVPVETPDGVNYAGIFGGEWREFDGGGISAGARTGAPMEQTRYMLCSALPDFCEEKRRSVTSGLKAYPQRNKYRLTHLGMTEMQKVARALNLPVSIVQEAETIKKQLEQKYPQEELKLIVAVAIILVYKKHKFKLDIAKLSKCIGVGKKDIIKARKRICLKDESSVLQKLRDLFS